MSSIWCGLAQLLILTANISGTDRDIDKRQWRYPAVFLRS